LHVAFRFISHKNPVGILLSVFEMKRNAFGLKLTILIACFCVAVPLVLISSVNSAAAQATSPDLQFCLILDGSGSMTDAEWSALTDAIGDAVVRNVPRDGTVELTVVQFGYSAADSYAKVEVTPKVITASSYASVANKVRALTQAGGSTSTGHGLYLAWQALKRSPNFSPFMRQAVNMATDQYPSVRNRNATTDLDSSGSVDAKDDLISVAMRAANEGLEELDVEGIAMSNSSRDWFKNWVVRPQPGTVAPPFTKSGWVRIVANVTELGNSMDQKFQAIIPELPSTLLMPLFTVVTLLAVVVRTIKKKKMPLEQASER